MIHKGNTDLQKLVKNHRVFIDFIIEPVYLLNFECKKQTKKR
jgi:hypothetical protein